MRACGALDGATTCDRKAGNHPQHTGFDEALDEFRDWPNADYRPPKDKSPQQAREDLEAVAAAVPRAERTGGFSEGLAASEAAARARWTEEQKADVYVAIGRVCVRNKGGGEFTVDDVWDELGGSVPITKGLTAIMMMAKRNGLCDTTGKRTKARRGGMHDHGQNLEVWYSLIPAL